MHDHDREVTNSAAARPLLSRRAPGDSDDPPDSGLEFIDAPATLPVDPAETPRKPLSRSASYVAAFFLAIFVIAVEVHLGVVQRRFPNFIAGSTMNFPSICLSVGYGSLAVANGAPRLRNLSRHTKRSSTAFLSSAGNALSAVAAFLLPKDTLNMTSQIPSKSSPLLPPPLEQQTQNMLASTLQVLPADARCLGRALVEGSQNLFEFLRSSSVRRETMTSTFYVWSFENSPGQLRSLIAALVVLGAGMLRLLGTSGLLERGERKSSFVTAMGSLSAVSFLLCAAMLIQTARCHVWLLEISAILSLFATIPELCARQQETPESYV